MLALYFLIGTIIGSFLTLVAWRVPRGESIIAPRSHCDNCQHRLGTNDLIPILSFSLNKGRCRYCKERLSPVLLLGEITAGLLSVSCFYFSGTRSQLIFSLSLLAFCLCFSLMDLFYHAIHFPIFIIFAIYLSGISFFYSHSILDWKSALFTASIFYLFSSLTHSFGCGDVDLLVLCALLFGSWRLGQVIMLACGLCLLTYPILYHHKVHQIAFIPYLSVALFILYFWH
ncbi:prepilin peptidase [Loigolactobacillus backii]|uniref:prepilin peptidase n=1 Tax=Loigolactobacillus backii TaxID=375175 RepID=UPI0007F0AA4A|nr:hypothetical protein AYR56_10760 [Loigolactobacillus backii]PIO82870.1 prepilin peptidase [Loigolactobacillus backii]